MPATQASISLFAKLGGKLAVETVVTEFYKRVLADEQLKGFFQGKDMNALHRHQVTFISQALGGPKQYSGRSMKAAHSSLHITASDFDRVAAHLSGTLAWAGVAQDDIKQVIGTVGTLKADVVNA